ncbi:MAG: BMP family ABC transporter substrate-binding protein [Lachnospiraceae bacterium]|nr:BMP family ABC transporter substrate-binding protein [Lachnospiraceae bacterium]
MKKKLLAMIVAVGMASTLLAGCGSSAPAPAEDKPAEEAPAEETPKDEAEAPADAAPSGDVDYSSLKIGALLTATKDDGGWCECQFLGLDNARAQLGMSEDQIMYIENCAEETVACTSAVEELIGEGCQIIIGCSTGYAPLLADLVNQYPDIQFVQCGAPVSGLTTYHIRAYDAMYGIGYLCALMSDTDKLGYVAGMSEASVRFSANAFALGARAANPNATVDLLWANSWYDPAVEGECATSLAAQGVKYMGTGCSSPGVAQACAKNGVFTTGYNLDTTDYAPEAVLVSCVWNWAPMFEEIFSKYLTEGIFVENYFWGAGEGCAQLSYNDALVSADLQAQVAEAMAPIESGEAHVFDGELLDNQGNVLVPAGETMSDEMILDQQFLVENVNGTF